MKKILNIITIAALLFTFACEPQKDVAPDLGAAPTGDFTIDNSDPNYIIFKVTESNGAFLYNWDFGNGQKSQKESDTVYYPWKGEYTVKLTLTGKGGATQVTKNITVTINDPTVCQNDDWNLLTGGCDALDGKTWVYERVDGVVANGPAEDVSTTNDPIDVSWWETPAGDFWDEAYDDEYTFKIRNFEYTNDCKGQFLWSWNWANELLGTNYDQWDDQILDYDPPQSTWKLYRDENDQLILEIEGGGYIGMANGRHQYHVYELTETTMKLRYSAVGDFNPTDESKSVFDETKAGWDYMRFVVKQ